MNKLPIEPPATGGWYWDQKAQQLRFLMPPHPGADDCVRVGQHWAYRSLAERDERKQLQAAGNESYDQNFDYKRDRWQNHRGNDADR